MKGEDIDESTGRPSNWRISKEIPLSLIITLLIQTASVVWWMSAINARVTNLEERRLEAQSTTQAMQVAISQLPERVLRLEIQINYLVAANQQLSLDLKNLQAAKEGGKR